jgi:cytochrome c oxidase subunit 3
VTPAADLAVLDAAALPDHAFGERTTLWWGVLLMLVIEGTMFAVMLASYLYLRTVSSSWPPLGTARPDPLAGTVTTVILLLSAVPQWAADRLASRAGSDRAIRVALVIGSIVSALVLVPRAFEFPAVDCRWDSHAYGSIVWTMLGVHTFHTLASVIETGVMTMFLLFRPVDTKHRLDLEANSLYWYFVVVSWVPIYATIYFGPMVL